MLHIPLVGISNLSFYCIFAFLCCCHIFKPSLCGLSPFLPSYAAVSRQCCLSEYPDRVSRIDMDSIKRAYNI